MKIRWTLCIRRFNRTAFNNVYLCFKCIFKLIRLPSHLSSIVTWLRFAQLLTSPRQPLQSHVHFVWQTFSLILQNQALAIFCFAPTPIQKSDSLRSQYYHHRGRNLVGAIHHSSILVCLLLSLLFVVFAAAAAVVVYYYGPFRASHGHLPFIVLNGSHRQCSRCRFIFLSIIEHDQRLTSTGISLALVISSR